jgi:uncharacterized protein YutE (UPF0331/DUF86 family)
MNNVTIDHERVMTKITYIKEQLTDIQQLLHNKSKEQILKDPWIVKGLKYSLQTAIEAMIDIVFHICAKHFNKAPIDARNGLEILVENRVIDENSFFVYSQMIGFRNRIVHGYQQISDERLYEIVSKELGDFNKFVDSILKFIK